MNILSLPNSFIKRMLDVICVFVLALFSLPLSIFDIFVIKRESSGPVFYTQELIGKEERTIKIFKLRTMVENAEQILNNYLSSNPVARQEWDKKHKLRNDPRVTRSGRWIRRFSIDELQELENILKGEKSLVGPRPLPRSHQNKFSEKAQEVRISVTPGLTGLWQVRGRSNKGVRAMEKLETYYVHN